MTRNNENQQINQHIKAVLQQTAQALLPDTAVPDTFIGEHIWRDSDYVGTHNGKVAVWRGWRLRLPTVRPKDQIFYMDVVDNVLPLSERQRLFGLAFAQAIHGFGEFVVMYVTGFPRSTYAEIVGQGFTPRELPRALHACVVIEPDGFLKKSIEELSVTALALLTLRQSNT